MNTPVRLIPMADFRARMGHEIGWVESGGGRLWITRHGRTVAGVVSMSEVERLESWEVLSDYGLRQLRRMWQEQYTDWRGGALRGLPPVRRKG